MTKLFKTVECGLIVATVRQKINVMEQVVLWYRLRSRVVRGVGHLGNDEAMEAGCREFDPRPGHYSRMSF